MANHDELVSQFADVTGVEAERALFYLESSAWQLEVRQHICENPPKSEISPCRPPVAPVVFFSRAVSISTISFHNLLSIHIDRRTRSIEREISATLSRHDVSLMSYNDVVYFVFCSRETADCVDSR